MLRLSSAERAAAGRVGKAAGDRPLQRVGRPRCDEVEHLRDPAGDGAGGDRPVLEGAYDAVRSLFRRQRGSLRVGIGRSDHRRADQWHPQVAERHAVAVQLTPGDPAPGVQRGLRRDVGGELRRLDLHAPRQHVDHVAELLLDHVREQAEHQPDRGDVVDRHRALDVVHAVVGQRDRPADRAACVVDQVVDATVLGQHGGDQPVDGRPVGEVAGVRERHTSACLDVADHAGQLVGAARHDQHRRATCGGRMGRGLADPRRTAGHQDGPPDQRRGSIRVQPTAQPGPRRGEQQAAHSTGRASAHGLARSSWAESVIRVVSSCCRPTSCTASGRPSAAKPAGTEAAGLPVTFHRAL